MKISKALIAALTLVFLPAAVWAGFWPISKEIPAELCGEYQQVGEIRADGEQIEAIEISEGSFRIETKRIVQINRETMDIKAVMKVKDKGKTAYIVTFKKSSLMWIMAKNDTPSQLAVVQSDEKKKGNSKIFILEQRNAPRQE